MRPTTIALNVAAALVLAAAGLDAQTIDPAARPPGPSVLIPHARAIGRPSDGVRVAGVRAGISIVEQVATTTLDIDLANPGGRRAEAELLVPVPGGAVLRGFDFHGSAAEPSAELLPR